MHNLRLEIVIIPIIESERFVNFCQENNIVCALTTTSPHTKRNFYNIVLPLDTEVELLFKLTYNNYILKDPVPFRSLKG